jgi:hypothetical protein
MPDADQAGQPAQPAPDETSQGVTKSVDGYQINRIGSLMSRNRTTHRLNVTEVRKGFSEARRSRLQRQLPMTPGRVRRNQATMKSGS